MQFSRSELALFDCGLRSTFDQTLEIVGEEATLELPAAFLPGESPTIVRRGERTQTIVCETANHYQLMVEHFAECVLNDHEPHYRATDSLNNMRTIDMLFESAKNT
jgi:predicted dehydrogenase